MKRILIADDDPDTLALLGNALEFHGHKVLSARDGQQAWQTTLREQPDVAILDVNMPVLNGFEVCRRLRANPRTRHMGIMFLTAREDVADKVVGFEAGADDYLVKPIQPRELNARVDALLKRIAVTRSAVLAEGPQGKVTALFGVKGGVGTSVLAANLAVALALAERRVVLVDLDLERPVAGLLLDVVPRRQGTIAELSRRFESGVDWTLMESFLSTHRSGVQVLPGPTSPVHAELVLGEHVRLYLDLLSRHFDHVLVDLASSYREASLDTFDICDQLLLVANPDLLALKSLRCALEVLRQLGVPNSALLVVMNHLSPARGLSAEEIKRSVELPIVATVPYGGDEFMEAVNQGTPLVQKRPQHPASAALRKLAEALGDPVPAARR